MTWSVMCTCKIIFCLVCVVKLLLPLMNMESCIFYFQLILSCREPTLPLVLYRGHSWPSINIQDLFFKSRSTWLMASHSTSLKTRFLKSKKNQENSVYVTYQVCFCMTEKASTADYGAWVQLPGPPLARLSKTACHHATQQAERSGRTLGKS